MPGALSSRRATLSSVRYSLGAAIAGLLVLMPARGSRGSAPSEGSEACTRDWAAPPKVVREQPVRRYFSRDGYLERKLAVELRNDAGTETHCVRIAWPPGSRNPDGAKSSVADRIDEAWFRAIANTLARVPASHARILTRIVIDNRPKEHGIAAHDRAREDDARDGRTLWLHEHVFIEPNHWAQGNYGAYFSYHVDQDRKTIDGSASDHALFSPVILHELGHLVMYRLVNAQYTGPAATSAPACAESSAASAAARRPNLAELETGCASPYCRSFQFNARTENWAEQYRFYYQGSATRDALVRSGASCMSLLRQIEPASSPAPWLRGLPDGGAFKKSRWQSCNGRPCKGW
jgi:hypothetical protein